MSDKKQPVKNYLTISDCIELANDEQKSNDEMIAQLKDSHSYYQNEYTEMCELIVDFDGDINTYLKVSKALSKGFAKNKVFKKYGVKKSEQDEFLMFHKINSKLGVIEAKLKILGEL